MDQIEESMGVGASTEWSSSDIDGWVGGGGQRNVFSENTCYGPHAPIRTDLVLAPRLSDIWVGMSKKKWTLFTRDFTPGWHEVVGWGKP